MFGVAVGCFCPDGSPRGLAHVPGDWGVDRSAWRQLLSGRFVYDRGAGWEAEAGGRDVSFHAGIRDWEPNWTLGIRSGDDTFWGREMVVLLTFDADRHICS